MVYIIDSRVDGLLWHPLISLSYDQNRNIVNNFLTVRNFEPRITRFGRDHYTMLPGKITTNFIINWIIRQGLVCSTNIRKGKQV